MKAHPGWAETGHGSWQTISTGCDTGQPLTVDQFWRSKENFHPAPLALDTPVPKTSVAIPGKTKLVEQRVARVHAPMVTRKKLR